MAVKLEEKYEAVDSSLYTKVVNLQNYVYFSAQLSTFNSSGFDAELSIEVSNDLTRWATVASSIQTVGDEDTQIYDVLQSSAAYCRIKVDVQSGSSDIVLNYILK